VGDGAALSAGGLLLVFGQGQDDPVSGLATLKNVGSRTKNVGSRAQNNQKQQKNLILSNQVNLTQVTKGSNVVCSLDSEPQLAFLNALKNGAAAAAATSFF
jgi:hypothetical protein